MKEIRCAVYTRKSTDEGLDKVFNTLEAQREAGENYIKSQKHQGWVLIDKHYDDGGYSGGNMKRPALQDLLEDIKAGAVDMIVVYKIDRLTRSLVDFSKMIDVFDQHNCSFVSVTQNFNTSDSMGRLTLNMLLSFAQFEREIGSERVRDKQAASKKRGMWTGGVVPYGYQAINKKLEIKPDEGKAVKFMFETYVKYKSAVAVAKLMADNGYKVFRRDAVKRMLKNPLYMGKIKYKDEIYEGQHAAIVSAELFEEVQRIRETKSTSIRTCLYKRNEVGILRGLLTCGCCNTPMTPVSSQTRKERRFYYTSNRAKYYGYHTCSNGPIPVPVMDECILKLIGPLLKDISVLNALIKKVTEKKTAEIYKIMKDPDTVIQKLPERHKLLLVRLLVTGITVQYDRLEINWSDFAMNLVPDNYKKKMTGNCMILDLPFVRKKGALILSLPSDIVQNVSYNSELIKALGNAFKYKKMLTQSKLSISELAFQLEKDPGYIGRILRLTCLAPDIIKSILYGTQPASFYLQRLLREVIPPIWEDQRKLYGFS